MQCIFIHGMAQWGFSWDETIAATKEILGEGTEFESITPDLWPLLEGKDATYNNLYTAFCQHLETLEVQPPYNLCGSSLGGRLALNYTIDHPEKVNSIMVIGTHPKTLKKQILMQKIMFKIMPKGAFINTGLPKSGMITLCNSLAELDLTQKIKQISCPTAILYGEKDSKSIKESAIYLAENIANATVAHVPNANHHVNADNPKGLAEKIVEFFIVK